MATQQKERRPHPPLEYPGKRYHKTRWLIASITLVFITLGELTIQGNIKALPSITEILQMALENGALRVLLPTGNKVQFSSLPEEVVEKMDIIFYSDVDRAITKAVEM
jgi:predicted ATP-dependent Lon-type protease